MSRGCRLVDLDGTLAFYEGWVSPNYIGHPITKMVERVNHWLAKGEDVRIFTARVFPIGLDRKQIDLGMEDDEYISRMQDAYSARAAINNWCLQQFGRTLPLVCYKDYSAFAIYDDRAFQVEKNTGRIIRDSNSNYTAA